MGIGKGKPSVDISRFKNFFKEGAALNEREILG